MRATSCIQRSPTESGPYGCKSLPSLGGRGLSKPTRWGETVGNPFPRSPKTRLSGDGDEDRRGKGLNLYFSSRTHRHLDWPIRNNHPGASTVVRVVGKAM